VLLNEEPATLALASTAGFRCFTSPSAFRAYVELSILRVAERVAHGGHNVPEAVLQRRFPRSLQLLLNAYATAVDHRLCNMNSGPNPAPVFSQSGAERTILDPVLYAQLLALAR
jgi:predicted ABC-type ATPase